MRKAFAVLAAPPFMLIATLGRPVDKPATSPADAGRLTHDPTVGPLRHADDAKSPVGYWKTIDDKTQKPRSIVEVWEQNGELRGRIERLIREPGEEQDPLCDKCKGEKHNQKIIGMEFLWGFKQEPDGWSDGYVLDPKEGNVYHGNLEVIEGGQKMRLFGYIRIIFKIGRSQTWERVKPQDFGLQ